jgi:hypothetical protein
MILTKREYKAISELYSEFNLAYCYLPLPFKMAFNEVLFSKKPYQF